ncbi:DUF2939 domain-containing protein [Bradyrhizobium cenepequi]|uniref:DUF2939 domain-containing protein n=1 Tax=Bradyrhizobium cenepequi TaxID=2821403 RepID=UPI0035DEC0C6|nr:DUF2939 domain-containing protein [Bradyrhizobium cenepequi]
MDWRALVVAVCLLIVCWFAWPYYAVLSLMQAARDGDLSTLERRVDWNSLRQALRGDLNARLLQRMNGKTTRWLPGSLSAAAAPSPPLGSTAVRSRDLVPIPEECAGRGR